MYIKTFSRCPWLCRYRFIRDIRVTCAQQSVCRVSSGAEWCRNLKKCTCSFQWYILEIKEENSRFYSYCLSGQNDGYSGFFNRILIIQELYYPDLNSLGAEFETQETYLTRSGVVICMQKKIKKGIAMFCKLVTSLQNISHILY